MKDSSGEGWPWQAKKKKKKSIFRWIRIQKNPLKIQIWRYDRVYTHPILATFILPIGVQKGGSQYSPAIYTIDIAYNIDIPLYIFDRYITGI